MKVPLLGDKSAMRQLCVSVPLVCVSLCYYQSPLWNDGLKEGGQRAKEQIQKRSQQMFLVGSHLDDFLVDD